MARGDGQVGLTGLLTQLLANLRRLIRQDGLGQPQQTLEKGAK
jgi:hypothetical protein